MDATEVATRLSSLAEAWVGVLELEDARLDERPSPSRWSVLEYAAHVRDVLLSVRERIMTAAILDDFTGVALHRDERVALGFYRLDSREELGDELLMTSRLFARTWTSLPAGYAERMFVFSPLNPSRVSIAWAGAQALHECVHHFADAQENVRLLSRARGRVAEGPRPLT